MARTANQPTPRAADPKHQTNLMAQGERIMETATARNIRPDRYDSEEWPAPVPDTPDRAPEAIDARSLDATQGTKIGSEPYDDPTQGRQIGSDPDGDPTRGRMIGSAPYDDATQGRKVGADPYDDPTQGQQIGSDRYDDPTGGP
jgi:hypothetical protein